MRIITFISLLVLVTACAEWPAGRPAAPSRSATSAGGVAVALTGVPVIGDNGAVEWCAGQPAEGGCPGIPVTGLSSEALEALDQSPPAWRVEGVYDGTTLRATGEPEPVERTEPDFTTPCAGMRGQTASEIGNMDFAASDAVDPYLATIPDRHAGSWWDSDNAVLTVLLTGDDVAEHRAALEEAVGDRGRVCVVGGARWSTAELDDMQRRALDIAVEQGMKPWGSGIDTVTNRVDLEVERSDAATVDRLREEFGEAVRVRSFLTVLDGTIRDLPVPPQRGDVELETADTRGGGGMDALARFTLRFDADERCVYGEAGSDRVGLIWPFGYWAESDPLRVYDQDGRLVAAEGDLVESGGGNVPVSGDEVCGSASAWAMNGRPEVVGPTEG